MLDIPQPRSRAVSANLFDDIHAAQALLSAVGAQQCNLYPPLPMPTP